MIAVKINGSSTEVLASNIAELVTELGLHPNTILIEHNLKALLRDEWQNTRLVPNDQIEILNVVAGG